MKNKIVFILAAVLFLTSSVCGQEKLNNLKTFAKVYGYVKYFHPSNEASSIDWNNFSAYGAKEVLDCHSTTELIDKLNLLFKPIAPTVTFSKEKHDYNFANITPHDIDAYTATYWQHLGVSFGMQYQYEDTEAYNSVRVNTLQDVDPIFEAYPRFGELITEKINDSLYCQIPLNLFGDKNNTYPISENLSELQEQLDSFVRKIDFTYEMLGNVINVYNIIQHFYPYFENVDVNWDKQLEIALERTLSDKTGYDHVTTLRKFAAHLKDGHMWISNVYDSRTYIPSIEWEWIENELVITKVYDESIDLKVGNIVTKINTQTTQEYFNEINSQLSSSTPGHLNYIAQITSRLGKQGTELVLEVDDKTINLVRNRQYNPSYTEIDIQENHYKILDNNIYYLNINTIEMSTITELLPELQKAKGIICDLRGYVNNNDDFISHLTNEDINAKDWFMVPQIIYPDQKNITGYEKSGWIKEAKEPFLGDQKIIFLVDGRTVSWAESYINLVKSYNLAMVVGQPTAGINGNVNPCNLLGYTSMRWTGMKAVNPDGSRHHGIGVLPDVYVTKTIKGITSKEDEFLQKAIEIILY